MPGQADGHSDTFSCKNSPRLCHFTDENTETQRGLGLRQSPGVRPVLFPVPLEAGFLAS